MPSYTPLLQLLQKFPSILIVNLSGEPQAVLMSYEEYQKPSLTEPDFFDKIETENDKQLQSIEEHEPIELEEGYFLRRNQTNNQINKQREIDIDDEDDRYYLEEEPSVEF